METWTKVLFNAAVATTITNISLFRTAPAALDELVVDATSAAAQLGPSLLPILSWLSASTSTNDHTNYNYNATQTSLQHLSHAAVTCPSLLAGNTQVLLAVDFSQELISSAAIDHLLRNSMGLDKPGCNHARQAAAASRQGKAALAAQLG
jgi:hypothetical protein